MGELVFVGLGLYDEKDVSLRGLEEARTSDYVFAEFYTSLMTGLSLERLETVVGKRVAVVSRKTLEDDDGEPILQKAEKLKVAFLVPGDPLIATTHIDLRIRAQKRGIKTKIVHGASIVSAAIGLSGLQNYRFGRSVTIPFSEPHSVYETPYNVVAENKARNLHTLCFLDIKAEEKRSMTIEEALKILLSLEEKKKMHIVTLDSLAVGIARAGAEDSLVKADSVKSLLNYDFGSPPHTLVFPAERLHFVEADALVKLAGAPESVKNMAR
ncbi:diphthine synthase [Candidatus Bathyarchaeota archaeon]|nr:diphthine synthase [Candidatus Bathyarchaeota archaeon]